MSQKAIRLRILPLLLFTASACSSEISGPKPTLTGLDPGLVCVEQLVTEVTISGDRLSPLAFDTLTDDPHVAVPNVSLQRRADPSGNAVNDPSIQLPNDPANPGSARVRWTDQSTMQFDVYPELGLQPGVYTVTVTNRNGQSVTLDAALAGVARPVIESVEPDLMCVDQGARSVTIRGTGFLAVGDTLPTVSFGGVNMAVTSVDDCVDLGGPATARVCSTAVVTIPEDGLAAGALAVVMTNPAPAGCQSTESPAVTVAIVPEPTLATVEPDLICTAQGDRTLTLTGTGFIQVNGALPTVTIGAQTFTASGASGCSPVAGTSSNAESCTTLTVTVTQASLGAEAHSVSVTNPDPAGCSTQQSVTLANAVAPVLASVEPDLVCNAEQTRTLTLTGTGFIDVGGTLPTVTIGTESYAANSATGCSPVAGTTLAAQSCTTLTVDVPQNALGAGTYDVSVTNPDPAGCATTESVTLTIVPPPSIASVIPDLTCNGNQASSFMITGTGFLTVNGTLPTVRIGAAALSATGVSGCTTVAGPTETVQTCTSLEVTVPAGTVASGVLDVAVENPAPAGCSSTQTITVTVTPPPTLASVTPSPVCTAQGGVELTLNGSGFLVVDGTHPTVTIGAVSATAASATGCTSIGGTSHTVSSCSTLTVVAPTGSVPPGSVDVFVTNPVPTACTSGTVAIQGSSPPMLTNVSPTTICEGGGLLTLTGSNFAAGMSVQVGLVSASNVTVVSPTEARATIGFGLTAGGSPYDVSVANGDGCAANLPAAVTVTTGPNLVFVDPPVVWNGTSTPVVVFGTNVTTPISDVSIVRTGTGDAPTSLSFSAVPGHPDRPSAIVPAGTTPGVYDVLLTDAAGCPALLSGALRVTDTTSLQLTGISPANGWTGASTPVTITASTVAPSPGFDELPIVYLTNAGLAQPVLLSSVARVSAGSLTATVPAGLTPGVYDVVAVNQDGTVGVLPNGFTVTTSPPPTVSSITPSQISNDNPAQIIDISGSNFRAAMGTTPGVTLRCLGPAGAALPDQIAVVDPSFTATAIQITIDATQYSTAANCLVVVTNTDDNSVAEFSSLVVVTQNLTDYASAPSLITGRRGLASVAGDASQSARFVYAIGGDDAVVALDSIETLPVDIFGQPGTGFFEQAYHLNTARTQIGAARIGRFIYVVGGTSTVGSSTAGLMTVERAAILDPAVRPTNVGVDIDLSTTDGLGEGVYYYRVSAVMPLTDPFNPGGETLASSTFGLRLPAIAGGGVRVTLTWDAVPGAVGYRIYRSSSGGSPSSVGLIADTTGMLPATVTCSGATACTDLGAVPDSSFAPLPLGSTGVWTTLSQTMATPRRGVAVTWAFDPSDPTRAYLYAFGGLDAAGTALDSYEFLGIDINVDGSQSIAGGFTTGTQVLSAPRWRLGAYTVTPDQTSLIGADTYVWAGGGAAADNSMVDNFDGARVQTGGELTAFTDVGPMQPASAGYGAVAAGDFLYVLAGAGGVPDATATSAFHTGTPPGVTGWNSDGPGLSTARVDIGVTIQGGYIYVLGGQTGVAPDVVTNSCEYVLY